MAETSWLEPSAPATLNGRRRRTVRLCTVYSGLDLAGSLLADNALARLETRLRRANSYTDFYYAARALLGRDGSGTNKGTSKERDVRLRQGANYGPGPGELSRAIVDSSHEKYSLYLEQLKLSRRYVDSLLQDTSTNLDLLSSLSASFRAIESQTSSFRNRCEVLLAQQHRLVSLADNVATGLQYYNLLDPITRRLNAPGAGHFVRGEDFSKMLSNLDECLAYMQDHPHHAEAAAYQARYRLLLTRALTLIRVHFTNTVREIAADVSKRIAEQQLTDTTMSALLYSKFRAGAPELKQMGLEIQKRSLPGPDAEPGAQGEYQSLLNELHQSFSAARGRLLVPLVRKKLNSIAAAPSTAKDLVAFSRSSIGFIRGICLDEYDLWLDWFAGDGGVYEFLDAMCEPLNDFLRPRTIRETQLSKLCDLCSLIQDRYMQEREEDPEPATSEKLDFSGFVRPALEDAQTRLVFQALALLRDKIERYKPTAQDLDCAKTAAVTSASNGPALSGRKQPSNGAPLTATPVGAEEDSTLELRWSQHNGLAVREWYPTLKTAIWLLGKIYRLVNSSVFDDLAHQIVHQTTVSLHSAASQIASKSSPTDSQLFLLKQLLTLKQQIVAFDIEFNPNLDLDIDFSLVTNTFWELRSRGGLFNPGNLLRLVGGTLMPRIVENMLDAKVELDGRLRTVINDFTTSRAAIMTVAVSEPLRKKAGFDGGAAVRTVRAAVEKQAALLRAKVGEYLADPKIAETLVAAVQEQVLQSYEEFFERHHAAAHKTPANGRQHVAKHGKGREDGVWDPDTFADWARGVFAVSSPDDDDGDRDRDGHGGRDDDGRDYEGSSRFVSRNVSRSPSGSGST